MLKLASFNVENLFTRPKAMDTREGTAEERKVALEAHQRLAELFERPDYEPVRKEILDALEVLGLAAGDEGPFVRLRKLRGRLLKRPKAGPVEIVATGRASWVGWVELKTTAVDETATEHTARVITDLNADVMTVVEADDRPGLELFNTAMLPSIGGTRYEQAMVIEGNDARGIDVGLLARGAFPIIDIRTHIFDADAEGPIFSRDCCEYHLSTPGQERLVVLANHFKSKGYAAPSDPIGAKRRRRQATHVATIYERLRAEGISYIAIMGDLNDDPTSESLQPLMKAKGLKDISNHAAFDWNHRRGTYGSGNERDKIDYILLSPALFAKATGGGVFRKGVWRGPRTRDPWEIYPSMLGEHHEASDHAAIYATFEPF